ncbi:hypothetical protein B9P99_00470 [Candidatus Marsarchaeota G1 archaeon OSP_B]|uniref:Uncharacterized protein n=1 Tax=Candidatus Marsarchaeota G1 archaeon OSP_B TaxID=1978153 RepID=A0A2R6BCJ2_9ARCH|nr:MAG: hypothetical protein B9P99_00470 [Candidatus Marsarchaeota G1 archaeon OSP_B]
MTSMSKKAFVPLFLVLLFVNPWVEALDFRNPLPFMFSHYALFISGFLFSSWHFKKTIKWAWVFLFSSRRFGTPLTSLVFPPQTWFTGRLKSRRSFWEGLALGFLYQIKAVFSKQPFLVYGCSLTLCFL